MCLNAVRAKMSSFSRFVKTHFYTKDEGERLCALTFIFGLTNYGAITSSNANLPIIHLPSIEYERSIIHYLSALSNFSDSQRPQSLTELFSLKIVYVFHMTCSYNTYYIIFGEETTMILVPTYRIGHQHFSVTVAPGKSSCLLLMP